MLPHAGMKHQRIRRAHWHTLAAGTVGVVIALTVAFAWQVCASYRKNQLDTAQDLRFERALVGVIGDNATLKLATRAALKSGGPEPDARYRSLKAGIEPRLRDLVAQAPSPEIALLVTSMVAADNAFTVFEDRAFRLATHGRREDALAMLSDAEYDNPLESFARAAEKALAALKARAKANDEAQRSRSMMMFGMTGFALGMVLVLVAWIALLSRQERIEERRLAAEALRESEEQHRAVFEAHPFPLWVYDMKTQAILAVNEAAVRHYRWTRDEFRAMTIGDLRPADEARGADLPLSADATLAWTRVTRHRRKDGSVFPVEVSERTLTIGGRLVRLATANDVTERTRLEEQFRQSQKMEAVGQLAGGVAHDFNNMLNVILGYTELTLRTIDPGDRRHRNLLEVRKAAERAALLTKQLLAFSRRQVMKPKVLELNAVVADMDMMLRRLIGEHIELATHLAPALGRVKVDPGQIGQVLLNLAVNARDAMPGGGRLTIETANVELSADYARAHPGMKPGQHVLLAVTDTGCGMTPEIRERIFEPFFTTKETGKGTGLGLSTVYGIVKQSGGGIGVYSEPGKGTAFKVYLPRVEAAGERIVKEQEPAGRASSSETLLLVEDDAALRSFTRELLTEAGYKVVEAADGAAALAAAEAQPGIRLLLTDVVMPRMNGRDVARRLEERRPGLKTVYMSGYPANAVAEHGALDDGLAFIEKPFTPQALVRKLEAVLEGAPA